MSKTKRTFYQLKKSWGLQEETSLEELLIFTKRKLEAEPNNPELLYTLAK